MMEIIGDGDAESLIVTPIGTSKCTAFVLKSKKVP